MQERLLEEAVPQLAVSFVGNETRDARLQTREIGIVSSILRIFAFGIGDFLVLESELLDLILARLVDEQLLVAL